MFPTLFLFFSLFLCIRSQSFCSADTTPFINVTIPLPQISPSDEIISGVTYGKIYAFPNGLWLLYQFSVSKSTKQITNLCPVGWLPPTKDDLNLLIQFANSYNKSILTDPAIFNMNTSMYYASNTKLYPNNTNASDTKAYQFYAIQFSLGKAYLGTVNSYFNVNKARVFCVHSSKSINNTLTTNSSIQTVGLSNRDLIKGLKYTFSISNTNILAYQWNFANQFNYSKDINVIPMQYGLSRVQIKVILFDGTTLGLCMDLWVRNYTGSEADTSLTLGDIHRVSFSERKFYRVYSLHFTAGGAPIAPIDTGGFYLVTTDLITREIFVKMIDNDGNQLVEFSLNRTGAPMDIVAVPWGFVILVIDESEYNKLYLYGHDVGSNTERFERIIMDNPQGATQYNSDQIIFYKDANGTAVFGMECMLEPQGGKLTLAKDRITAIFSHYNFFGYNPDGSKNQHTGDVFLNFNLSGQDEKLTFAWGASHSLSQNSLYNGEHLLTSALGDAYPINIRVTRNDVNASNGVADPKTGLYNRLGYSYTTTLINGTIPGDGAGFSCGRMGTMSVFGDGSYNVLSYARRPCNLTLEGTLNTNKIDEIGLLFFNNNLTQTSNVSLGPGKWVNQVQSVKYGNNIFLCYVTSNRTDTSGQTLSSVIDLTDVMTAMLLSNTGKLLAGPYNLGKSILPSTDNLRILNDGRVAWTFVDENYTLNYYYLTKPDQTPLNEEKVSNSGFYQEGLAFYLISPSDQTVYISQLGQEVITLK